VQHHQTRLVRSAQAIAFAGVASISALPLLREAPAAAADAGGFAALAGMWTGDGTVSLQDGTKTRIHCRAQYVVTDVGHTVLQSLRCGSDTDEIHINVHITDRGGSLSGSWTEEPHDVSGTLTGRLSGDALSINVAAGRAFSAHMSVLISGRSQSVEIKPNGIKVTDISVSMSKTP